MENKSAVTSLVSVCDVDISTNVLQLQGFLQEVTWIVCYSGQDKRKQPHEYVFHSCPTRKKGVTLTMFTKW